MADDNGAKQVATRTGRSLRLPGATLGDVLIFATASNGLGGPAPKEIIAEQARMSAGGGRFKTKFAAAQYYELLEKDGQNFRLTELGERAISSDTATAGAARRAAVMSSGFGAVLRALASRPVQKSAVVGRIRADLAVEPGPADSLADVLIETARDVGLIEADRFVASAIAEADSYRAELTDDGGHDPQEQPSSDIEKPSSEEPVESANAGNGTPTKQEERLSDQEVRVENSLPPSPVLQVVINIDASQYSAEELATLLRELRQSQDPTS